MKMFSLTVIAGLLLILLASDLLASPRRRAIRQDRRAGVVTVTTRTVVRTATLPVRVVAGPNCAGGQCGR